MRKIYWVLFTLICLAGASTASAQTIAPNTLSTKDLNSLMSGSSSRNIQASRSQSSSTQRRIPNGPVQQPSNTVGGVRGLFQRAWNAITPSRSSEPKVKLGQPLAPTTMDKLYPNGIRLSQ